MSALRDTEFRGKVSGIQYCFIADWIYTGNQPSAPLENRDIYFACPDCGMGRSKAESQPFLDQSSQAGPLLRGQRFGIGQQ